jgi:SMI1 / KNR4 family (SUKH-1)
MPEFEWKAFLTEFNRELLASAELRSRLPQEVAESGWLGSPGASEAEISEAEARLGVRLPPSYRSFLQFSNGWRQTGFFIDRLWPADHVAWFKERNQQWIDAYTEPASDSPPPSDEEYLVYGEQQDTCIFREEYLKTALEISDTGDACIMLLNPKIVTPDGEWEAWFFANWYPGAARFRSFRELMEEQRQGFQTLMQRQNAPKAAKTRRGFISQIRSLFGAKKSGKRRPA